MMNYSKIFATCIIVLNFGCNPSQETKPQKDLNDFPFLEMTVSEMQDGFKSGSFTISEVTQSYLDRIAEIDDRGPKLNAVIQVNPDAMKIAQKLDEELAQGQSRGSMHGIPVLLKDNIDTYDKMHTTAGSRALKGSKPLQDSKVAEMLRESGAVILGKANLSEWANFRGEMSSSGWSGIGGQTKNPYKLDRNPCGSSSGSGSAVSANLAMITIGTETNGSIVCPSNANGVVGIKPTVGLVSRSGIIPISFTQDTAGPMARSLADAAACLGALVSVDSSDSKTLSPNRKVYEDYTQFLKPGDLKGKRIGWYTGPRGRHRKVDEVMSQAIDDLKNLGAEIVEIEQISEENAGRHSFQVMLFEYKDGLNKYFTSLGPSAKIKSLDELVAFNKSDSIEMAFYNQEYLEMANEKEGLGSEEYKNHLAEMFRITRQEGIDRVMNENQLDAIVSPTGSPAWKTDHTNGDSFHVGSSSPAARAGYPDLTIPMGMIEGLPVGISFFGRAWSESLLIEVAYIYEQATQHRTVPQFLAN